jgi:hypothetical protein
MDDTLLSHEVITLMKSMGFHPTHCYLVINLKYCVNLFISFAFGWMLHFVEHVALANGAVRVHGLVAVLVKLTHHPCHDALRVEYVQTLGFSDYILRLELFEADSTRREQVLIVLNLVVTLLRCKFLSFLKLRPPIFL